MSQPTLYYFNGRGNGEYPRLILSFANVQFNDNRVNGIDDALKTRLPFGQLPFYEDEQVQLAQSKSIARYVAQKYKVAGKNEVEVALSDAIAESIYDLVNPFLAARGDAEKTEKFKTETAPRFLNNWEALLLKNGGKNFVGESFTYADVAVFHALDYFKFAGVDLLGDATKYPTLNTLTKSVSEIPSLKAYLDKRPTDSKF
ncbi:putative glutathione S-transferase [Cavenderia fasciculata]|uniref:Glutathione S-transferase n=1 Tax=Cavenderia fasciculata TaxID=261658 RepID=F4Q0R5_CACFS|nr:putative glutathione S-transferase [Cavenderia fasciculata]EGG18416.1 putative glutathione S-transferase [Cavenderia fasciculata]|eukprot:XP_004366320.1 putative glutathione S-transferase [Cavenderia fasciculata]